ncbi:MAG: TetR/AcrR family transcriptional regulator [Actinobacteria bacterium]|nr:TetR/AcrR family transcriptional regulator [Actinomycetota bacterium]
MAPSEVGNEAPRASRHTRRKAATRAKITQAANQLFSVKGYQETSVEDISELADVAVRTIYMHFPSKAAILLDHFDRWLDALVDGILRQPIDTPIADAVETALAEMVADGWEDRSYGDIEESPPAALGLIAGPPEVAGYMMQAWAVVQERIANDARERGSYSADSLIPQARAIAVFAACMAPIMTARLSLNTDPLPEDATANGLIGTFITHLTRGAL